MLRTILGSDQANSVKNTEINKQSHVKFWFFNSQNRKNVELSHIYLAVSMKSSPHQRIQMTKKFLLSALLKTVILFHKRTKISFEDEKTYLIHH